MTTLPPRVLSQDTVFARVVRKLPAELKLALEGAEPSSILAYYGHFLGHPGGTRHGAANGCGAGVDFAHLFFHLHGYVRGYFIECFIDCATDLVCWWDLLDVYYFSFGESLCPRVIWHTGSLHGCRHFTTASRTH